VLRRVVTIALLLVSTAVYADDEVGIVVGGADQIHTQSETAVAGWLTHHYLKVTPNALSKDGVATLLNCLVIADMSCARTVVEARATTDNVISITELATGKKAKRSVQLSAYWIAKKHDVVSLQRTCENCSDAVLTQTIDAMLSDLIHLVPAMNGHVHITSDPAGTATQIDHEPAGATPIDRDLAYGAHTITLTKDGKTVGEKQIDVQPGAKLDVAVPIHIEAPPPPRIVVVKVKEPAKPITEEPRSRAVPAVSKIESASWYASIAPTKSLDACNSTPRFICAVARPCRSPMAI